VQDNRVIGEENEATSLLVLPDQRGERKRGWARAGWRLRDGAADIIERWHHGQIPVTENDGGTPT
jgi:hypothetical protein